MAAKISVKLSVRVAWWFTGLYLPLLAAGMAIGLEPNPERLSRACRAAIRVTVTP